MKYVKTICMLLIVSSLLLAGCVSKEKSSNASTINTSISEKISDGNTTNVTNITVDLTSKKSGTNQSFKELDTNKETITTSSKSWCQSDSKAEINGKVYTIVGIVTHNNMSMCKAVIQYENGSTVRYFSEDGKKVDEESVSSSGNAKAVSSASSSIK